MTRKAGANRCMVCGHPADKAACGRNHGAARSLHGKEAVAPGRGLPPIDLVSGITDVGRSVFTIVLGRAFVGTLRRPVAANVIAALAFAALFWFGLLPAFEQAFRADHNPALWGLVAWVLVAPPTLELIAGPAQNGLRAVTEREMLGSDLTPAPKPPALGRLGHRGAVITATAVLLLLGLAAVQIPWVGVPLVLLAGAVLTAFVWFDAAMTGCGCELRERTELLWRNRWRALGVGFGLLLVSAVPFLNLLLWPSVAAVATTSAFVRFDKRPASLPDLQ